MKLIFCPHAEESLRLDRHPGAWVTVRDWDAFEAQAQRAERLGVVVKSLRDQGLLLAMRRLRLRLPGVPWLLVTDGSPHNLMELRHLEVEGVLPLSDLDALGAALGGLRKRPVRPELARFITECTALSRHEHRLLAGLFLADSLPRSIREWGQLVHLSEDSVKHHFRRIQARGGPAAGFVLNVNLLLGAHEAAGPDPSWNALASVAEVSRRRLIRTAEQLTGEDPAILRRRGRSPVVLAQAFVRVVERVA